MVSRNTIGKTTRSDSQRFVDRGEPLKGVQKTVRDSRLPYSLARNIENLRLPDQKAKRRDGFDNFITEINGDAAHVRVRGTQLCKHTPTVVENTGDVHTAIGDTIKHRRFGHYRSPLSYGLIKWHDDFQPKIGRNFTLEFLLTVGEEEELVVNPVERETMADQTSAITTRGFISRQPDDTNGVYVYDQTVLANGIRFEDYTSSVIHDVRGFPGANSRKQLFAIPALAVSYKRIPSGPQAGKLQISVAYAIYYTGAGAGHYEFHKLVYVSTTDYAAGTSLHVAIVHSAISNACVLFVDGSTVSGTEAVPSANGNIGTSTYTVAGAEWAGENDYIDDLRGVPAVDAEKPRRRDIVILNEFIARGNYGSTKKSDGIGSSYNTFVDNISRMAADVQGSPLACSPPRGTCIAEIRFWHSYRGTANNIENNKHLRIMMDGDAVPTNLKGYWPCDDGGAVCRELVDSHTMTLHHNVAQYVTDSGLLHGKGLLLRDGQHLIKSYQHPLNTDYVEDSFAAVERVFRNRRINSAAYDGVLGSFNTKFANPDQDFTIQMEFRTPKNFQYSLQHHYTTGAAAGGKSTPPGTDVPDVDVPAVGSYGSEFELMDGVVGGGPYPFTDDTGANNLRGEQFLTPYDETLWSIEGTAQRDTAEVNNLKEWTRIPLARGVISSIESGVNAGKGEVSFEFFVPSHDGATAEPRYYRATSTTLLDPDTVYTITFRKVTRYGFTDINGDILAVPVNTHMNPVETEIEIFVDDELAASAGLSLVDSTPCGHDVNYDVIIGASYVNNLMDKGLYRAGTATLKGNILPHQHFMTPNMDQPGFFTLGFWRMWSIAVPRGAFNQYLHSSIVDSAHQPALIFNLEMEKSTGAFVPNKARYVADFKLGYKSFGAVAEDGFAGAGTLSTHITGSWAMEDCIGYAPLPAIFDTGAKDSQCTALAPYKTPFSQEFGLLTAFDSALLNDPTVEGKFSNQYLPSRGLLNEYSQGHTWQISTVGKRTFLLGEGGFPKVFNGHHMTRVGLQEWNAGGITLTSAVTGGSINVAAGPKYIGVRVVYVSEEFDLISPSTQFVVTMQTGATSKITLTDVSSHPDPRCSSIYIYRTFIQDSYTEALIAPVLLTPEGPMPNKQMFQLNLTQPDTNLIASALDLSITSVPDAKYSAVLDGQLYVASDKLNEVALYRSFPGNPEQFDKIATEAEFNEGLGDSINGMIAAFGAVWIFRATSIWRYDPLDSTTGQLTKVNNLGVTSPHSLQLITLPDQGAPVIFMWTRHGPYLFDSSGFNYIGYGLEADLDDPFSWLEAESVRVVHSAPTRELMVFYRSIDGANVSDRFDKCAVHNYRFSVWYDYTGILGGLGLDTVISTSSSAAPVGVLPLGSTPINYSQAASLTYQKNVTLIGDQFGRIWEWGASVADGLPAIIEGTVQSYVGNLITLTAAVVGADYKRGLWVTVVKADKSAYFIWPIEDTTTTGIYLDTGYLSGAPPFNPVANDTIIIGAAPARLTFPWDVMDVPYIDKQINALVTWRDKNWYLRHATDWDESTYSAWILMADLSSQRSRASIGPINCEALKLDLVSYEIGARLDAMAYDVLFRTKGVTVQ